MADALADGNTRVAVVPTIAVQALPTTAELNAGILLQSFITPDGLIGFEATTAEIDNSSLASTFDTKTIGRTGFSGTMLRLKKQSATDTPFTTLVRGYTAYIVIRRNVLETTAWTSAQFISIFPIICGDRRDLAPEPNSVQKYEVPMMIYALPTLSGAVA